MQCQRVARSFGKASVMNPHPEVPQNQRYGQKKQPQPRIPRAGVDSRLSHLAKTGLDAESQTVQFADFGGGTVYAPRREQQLQMPLLAVLAVAMSAVANAYRNLQRLLLVFHHVRIPARRLTLDPAKAGRLRALFGARPRMTTGITNGSFSLLQEGHNRSVEKRAIQQHTPDFQAISRILATIRRSTRTIDSWRRTQVRTSV